jgi:D-beta-D-heptose 7-phosphate kinase/D-beta-D-heptose 1-phosphate adenosyltransferase
MTAKVLVIGDVIADVYRDCYFKKMCPDAPSVKAVVNYVTTVVPGGAANVAVNIAALSPDSMVHLIGVVDQSIANSVKRASKGRVWMDYCSIVKPEETLRKERICLDGETLLRVDQYESVPESVLIPLREAIEEYFCNYEPDVIVFSDYGGGVLRLFWECIPREYRDRVLVDTKQTDLSMFEGCWMIKLNKQESDRVLLHEPTPEKYCGGLVVTLGDRGACLYVRLRHSETVAVTHTMVVNSHKVSATDPCGCGDTFLAGLAASLLLNGDMFSAVQFANAAASTVVTERRTAVADLGRTLGLVGRGSDEVSTGRPDRDHRDSA